MCGDLTMCTRCIYALCVMSVQSVWQTITCTCTRVICLCHSMPTVLSVSTCCMDLCACTCYAHGVYVHVFRTRTSSKLHNKPLSRMVSKDLNWYLYTGLMGYSVSKHPPVHIQAET